MDPEDAFDEWSRHYDALYRDVEIGDLEFYRRRASIADGPVLEVGCGTGRIYLELLRHGVDVHGIDRSGGMLDVLREKAAAADLEPRVSRADARSFDLDLEFELVVMPFRAFLHLLTIEDQLAALERIHAHLAPDGEFVCNFFVPDPEVIVQYGATEEAIRIDGEEYRRIDRQRMADPVDEVVRVERALLDGEEPIWETSFDVKLVRRREFELLLTLSPFAEWDVYGGFDGRRLEDVDDEMVWMVRP